MSSAPSIDHSSEVLQNYARYRKDPWAFLTECVYTHDEVDAENPIKPYPSDWDYLYFLVGMWHRKKKIAVPKSRRMTVSWTMLALILWDCIFHKGRSWAVVSKKEEASAELVGRCEFIYNHIPEGKLPHSLLPKIRNKKMQVKPPKLVFPEILSKIEGFPQGGDQLRQYGFSGIFEDECAFWEQAEESFAAAEPTIKGGGRMVMVSSRSAKDSGFFKRVCFDRFDATGTEFPEVAPAEVKHPMTGIEVWENPSNEFTVIDLHYTANPAKRSEAFRKGLKAGLPIRKYRMEYERSWETHEGKPVYEDFNPPLHLTQNHIPIEPTLPLILGWDFGLTPACVIVQLERDQLKIIKEFTAIGGLNKLAPRVLTWISLHSTGIVESHSFIDPAGLKRNENDERTCAQSMREYGFTNIKPGPTTWKAREDAVTHFLTSMSQHGPGLLVSEVDCPVIASGFRGGYRYPEKNIEVEPTKIRPVKDKYSHPHDALQYASGGIKALMKTLRSGGLAIPTPTYGFQKRSASLRSRR